MKKIVLLLLAITLLTACTSINNTVDGLEPPAILEMPPPTANTEETAVDSHILSFSPEPSLATPPENIYSRAVYVYNLNEGVCVYKTNENEELPPASIAKIMTCLTVLENVSDLEQVVVVNDYAYDEFSNGDPNKESASVSHIESGQENVTYLDCLYGLMLKSGCEAANILAYNAGGYDIDAFVDMMNSLAKDIGCQNTNFKNASGLYETDYYSTAYDMFLITKYAYDNHPLFKEIYTAKEYEMPPNEQFPNGYILSGVSRYLPDYITGIKTGSIYEYFDESGQCLDGFTTFVSIAEKDGISYMTVTMDADYYDEERGPGRYHVFDHIELCDWAYSTFSYQ